MEILPLCWGMVDLITSSTTTFSLADWLMMTAVKLQKQVAIVTGAASGIGRATAKLFVNNGCSVIGIDRNIDGLKSLQNELNDNLYSFYEADVKNEKMVKSYIDEIYKKYGQINILCNIAGGHGPLFKPIYEIETEEFNYLFETHVMGMFYNIKYCTKYMINNMDIDTNKSIINTTSRLGFIGAKGIGAYVTCKHAVIGLTRSVCADCAQYNIRCNAIVPGLISGTNVFDESIPELMERDEEKVPLLQNLNAKDLGIPMERGGSLEEAANLYLFLASNDSSYINGSCYEIDGGWLGAPGTI